MKKVKVLALAGSSRKDSFNKKLIRRAAHDAREAGADVTLVDIADYPLPPYDGDLEESTGLPENAVKLKKLFIEHQGFLFASPEYNSSISGTFKNLIDWVSRPDESDPYYLVAYKGKTAAIMSASPGNLGGLRGLVHLRALLGNVGVIVIPDQVTVSTAHNAFDEQGHLKDEHKQKQLHDLVSTLVTTTHQLQTLLTQT